MMLGAFKLHAEQQQNAEDDIVARSKRCSQLVKEGIADFLDDQDDSVRSIEGDGNLQQELSALLKMVRNSVIFPKAYDGSLLEDFRNKHPEAIKLAIDCFKDGYIPYEALYALPAQVPQTFADQILKILENLKAKRAVDISENDGNVTSSDSESEAPPSRRSRSTPR